MSLNWVMLPDSNTSGNALKSDFIPLPNERTIFKSNPRTSLSLSTPRSTYPANTPSPNVTITSSDGTLYLSNQRVIYLPRSNSSISSNVANFKSFSCPLLNLHDTHLVMPWFGPNAWTALVQPVAGGGLPSTAAGMEVKFTFKEGGAPEFQTKFEAIKERLQQVVESARAANTTSRRSGMPGLDMANVHLDQLPSYQDSGHDRIALDNHSGNEDEEPEPAVPANATADQVRAMAARAATQRQESQTRQRSRQREDEETHATETPNDAPPGYEETQQQSISDALESRFERT